MSKRYLSLMTLSFILISSINYALGYAIDEVTIYNSSGELKTAAGDIGSGIIVIEIPENSYIYANPKGEGIGKATEIYIEKKSLIKRLEIKYPKGEKYYASGDSNPVNIYRKTARFHFIYEIEKNVSPENYTLKADISLLMCTQNACFPIEKSMDIPISVTGKRLDKNSAMMNNFGEFLSLKNNESDIKIDKNIKITSHGNISVFNDIIFTPNYPDGKITGIIQAVIFGLIAGFILNFMPCVLPVVSLKIMSFVLNAGEEKKVIAGQGFFFSLGIVVSFIFLAVLAAFFGYKWGTLFQNKSFVIIMASFIYAMALSFLGVFTFNISFSIRTPAKRGRGIYTDSFFKGIIATLLATPCSGPFLGGTLAWTLTMSPAFIFIVFLSVGIGMALPYMLLSLNPSLLRFIPKPGEWMNHFQIAMGFILMFTVVYLFSVLDNSTKVGLILFLLFLSIGLWQFGKFGSIDKERWKRYLTFIILLAIIITGYFFSFKYLLNEKVYAHKKTNFSIEKILSNKKNGIITVVNFTADWCPNCSLVEKLSLQNPDVQKLLSRDNIEFMVADITKRDIEAELLMDKLGSRSIPFLAVFPAGEDFNSPICLRDIYSAGDVIDALTLAEQQTNNLD
ncbi:MAG: thioredoxin family protein [Spirochaetes bacterium]|nr:thioredoxin family protein [Spirochaetota bacterium]